MDRSERDPVQSWYSPPVPADPDDRAPWPGPWTAGPNPPMPGPTPAPTRGPSWQRATAAIAALALSAALGSGATWVVLSDGPERESSAAAVVSASVTTGALSTTGATETSLVEVIEDAEASIVTITAAAGAQGFRRMSETPTSVGSGIVVTRDGYILTNAHVVDEATTLSVELFDGREYAASVVDAESDRDLALIRIDAAGLAAASLGDSTSLRVGEAAIAIGSPLGTYTGSVTLGIISALDREVTVNEGRWQQGVTLSGLIQTDAAINEGNSGGALLNAVGEVIGITTAIAASAQGVGFAIPIEAAASLLAVAGAA